MFDAAPSTAAPALEWRLCMNSYRFPILLIVPVLLIVLLAMLPGCGLCSRSGAPEPCDDTPPVCHVAVGASESQVPK